MDISHGQSAGCLGPDFDPFHLADDPASAGFDPRRSLDRAIASAVGVSGRKATPRKIALAKGQRLTSPISRNAFNLAEEREAVRDAYGRTTFGQSCLLARRLVEAGIPVVTVNMFDTVFDRVTWDCHGSSPFSTLNDYAEHLLPTFDLAFDALLEDLERTGRLESTLVVAAGEFGRTPRINGSGGRDHWPGVWSVALAGGGVRGGQVVGSSDPHAACPADRPVTPQDLLATMYYSLGIDASRSLTRPDGESRDPRRCSAHHGTLRVRTSRVMNSLTTKSTKATKEYRLSDRRIGLRKAVGIPTFSQLHCLSYSFVRIVYFVDTPVYSTR